MSPESITTHGCSRISILFSVILSSLLRILSRVFYSFLSPCYVWLRSFLKLNCSCLIWKRKQHKFETFFRSDQVSELRVNNESFQSSVRSACSGLNISNRTESKQCENKLLKLNEISVHNN